MGNNLPGYNCGQCGKKTCKELAKSKKVEKCPFYKKTKQTFHSALMGVIDSMGADFRLKPLKGEPSCREFILPIHFKDPILPSITTGDVIKYRPLGCPVPHFAKIIQDHAGIFEIHLVGPKQAKYYNIGICMVLGFIGNVEGYVPKVAQTVKFIPDKCMMQKVHSGVVTQVEGKKIRIEGIDLKVWKHEG